ncbi:efflux RND transporter periplasmic adaptor subunit [Flavisolibacter sp. BT320]|nr:efflux RND transporter periplasmic adaptor subunit [Flavisolibacter longurius]
MKKSFIVKIHLLLAAFLMFAGCKGKNDSTGAAAQEGKAAQQYTCPMHPQIVQDKPGKCPICGMDLVPKTTSGTGSTLDTGLAHLLKPVNEQVVARTTTVVPESGMRIFSVDVQGRITYDTRRQTSIASRVSGRIEKLYIKYNYQPVRAGQLIMEIYSPDLAAAQRELIFLSRGGGDRSTMLPKARQRLQLLGMQPAQIDQVMRTGKVMYRVPVYSKSGGYILEKGGASVQPSSAQPTTSAPASGGGDGMAGMGGGAASSGGSDGGSPLTPAENSPLLLREGQYIGAGQTIFTVYSNSSLVAEFAFNPALASQVKKGQKLVFRKPGDAETVYTGSIGLIQPTLRAGQSFTLARVYVTDNRFQIGQLVSANIPVVGRGWWVPASAVLQLGTRAVVFKKEGNVFVPKTVNTGMRNEGLVQIMEGVSGWEIAKKAAYLVDSESFIRVSSNNQTE